MAPDKQQKPDTNISKHGTKKGFLHLIFGSKKINLPLGLLALLIISSSLSVLAYNNLNKETSDTITVNDKEYVWDVIFEDFEIVDLDNEKGVRLSDLVNDTELDGPEEHDYRIIASDGYVKTVSWEDMTNGIIMKNRETYFPDLPKQFHVKDVIEIEVN